MTLRSILDIIFHPFATQRHIDYLTHELMNARVDLTFTRHERDLYKEAAETLSREMLKRLDRLIVAAKITATRPAARLPLPNGEHEEYLYETIGVRLSLAKLARISTKNSFLREARNDAVMRIAYQIGRALLPFDTEEEVQEAERKN